MILLDTSGILAALFDDQKHHEECAQIMRDDDGPYILSPFVLAEADYLILKYGGIEAEQMFLEDVELGRYLLAEYHQFWMGDTRRMVHRYRDLNIGITDASLIVLADEYKCYDVLTLDLRHFRALRSITRKVFRILPADL